MSNETRQRLSQTDTLVVDALFQRMRDPLGAEEQATCERLGMSELEFRKQRNRELFLALPGLPDSVRPEDFDG
jgi:hypothetical protein